MTTETSTKMPRAVKITFLLSVLYNVCFFLQFMTTAITIRELGISDSANGYIQTLFGVLQMVGGPLYGVCIQRFGIRASLILCYASVAISSLLLYAANDVAMVVLSRIPSLFMHGQQGHQTLLSALTEPGKERTNAFGRMGLTFGVGFIFTPVISIICSRLISAHAPLLASALLCLVPIAILLFVMDRASYENHESKEEQKGEALTFTSATRILQTPGIANVMFKKNAPIAPCLLIFAVMQLYMMDKFAVNNEMNQLIQLLTGVCIMFSNGFGVIYLRKKFSEQTILKIGTAFFSIAYVLFLFFDYLWVLAVIMPFLSLGMSTVATVADSLLTALVNENDQGLVLGVATSVNSLVRTFAPAIAGSIVAAFGFKFLAVIGSVATLVGHFALYRFPLDESLLHKSKRD